MRDAEPEKSPSEYPDDRRRAEDRPSGHLAHREPGGYREVLQIAVPLILSTASLTVALFVDRMFLAWYGETSVAAATPGGITYFTFCSFFFGTTQYVNSIVAQHYGAGDRPACARAVWQGIFFSIASVPVILALIPLSSLIFSWSGHGAKVAKLEADYFSILMVGGVMLPVNASLSSFFSGRGKTGVVMWGNVAGNAANVLLDYLLIFGKFGFPEMGIRGAGLATAVTGVLPALFWGGIFLSARYEKQYRSRREFRWDNRLFLMLIRYGVPSGVQFFLDVASFALFVLLVGRLGVVDLAATNIVLSIELLSFLPMIGMSIATATLVGKYIGRGNPSLAERSVYSALKLALGYMTAMALLFFFFPEVFLAIFKYGMTEGPDFATIVDRGTILLRIVAVYTVFDTLFIIFSGALKGAGDTRFAMWAQTLLAWIFFVPPVYLIIEYLDLGLYVAWSWGLVYVILLGTVFWARFHSGYWKQIQMIKTGSTGHGRVKPR
ncbi:MAG: MATE family efflux transporter [Deltaproteobacteria bacterium]